MVSEEELKQQLINFLAEGPRGISDLAGRGFGKAYNAIFHEGSRKNNGSFKKWLASIPGIEVEESAEWCGGYCVKLSVHAVADVIAEERQAMGGLRIDGLEAAGDGNPEEDLKRQLRGLLAMGPKSLSDLAGPFGKEYNSIFHAGAKKRSGSFKKWLGTVEGVELEESTEWEGGCCIKLSCQAVSSAGTITQKGIKRVATAPLRPHFPVGHVGNLTMPRMLWREAINPMRSLNGVQALPAPVGHIGSLMMPRMLWREVGTLTKPQPIIVGIQPTPISTGGTKRKIAPTSPVTARKERKFSVDTAQANLCLDFIRNQCKHGDSCTFDHVATSAALRAKAHEGSHIKGRTAEEKDVAKAEYATWAEERLQVGTDPEGVNAQSLDWWYCQVCLCCLAECSYRSYVSSHMNGAAHRKKFIQAGGYAFKPGVLRPDPNLERPLESGTIARFTSCAGFAKSRVLSLGEQDYSFSLAIARLQVATMQEARLVATSYLAAHDPNEPEVHIKDDGMRAWYSRKSLPGMDGALQRNIDEAHAMGATVLHGIDATDLPGTLLPVCGETFDLIVFSFPRASLQRSVQPKNSRLLRNFFRSVNETQILEPKGKIGIVLLRTQYAEWDTACVALEAGYHLTDQSTLPDGFYQGREMSGKIFDSWKAIGAEIYMFQKSDEPAMSEASETL
eukprot:TRINITY_DN4991_c0_g1_i1.p1 TRINITY_DN4991_c0_g1~~TRINITY_DN4991_c0_g1_i1.p1  ORF type:complete len:690 (-),score=87.93 TRINITY_DN4991_c0_g1_i1:154-2178(-)